MQPEREAWPSPRAATLDENSAPLLDGASLPPLPGGKLRFDCVYDRAEVYHAALRIYTKSLFGPEKALAVSHDGRTLYDFAGRGSRNLARLHAALERQEFHFGCGSEVHYVFKRGTKTRTMYLFPWEERIVDQFLFQVLNRRLDGSFSSHSYAFRCHTLGLDLCQYRIAQTLQSAARPFFLVKRDVANYYPSVNHEILLRFLAAWIDPVDYLYRLLQERIKFRFRSGGEEKAAVRGVPQGSPIACLFANIYLTPLDFEIASIPGLSYFRYADDILALTQDRETAAETASRVDRMFPQLELRSKASHHKNLLLTARGRDTVFAAVPRFQHLGLEYRSDGTIGLSRAKARKIRNFFRYGFGDVREKLALVRDPRERATLLIGRARDVVERGCRSGMIIDYYLKHIDDEAQVKLLDRWLAEEILARVFENGHRKGNFQGLPFRLLRQMGLPSLRHRHRLLIHGKIKSSFLAFRINSSIEREVRRSQQEPGRTGEGRLPGRKTFSPRLEAAAMTAS